MGFSSTSTNGDANLFRRESAENFAILTFYASAGTRGCGSNVLVHVFMYVEWFGGAYSGVMTNGPETVVTRDVAVVLDGLHLRRATSFPIHYVPKSPWAVRQEF